MLGTITSVINILKVDFIAHSRYEPFNFKGNQGNLMLCHFFSRRKKTLT